jgi:hypothetical protein
MNIIQMMERIDFYNDRYKSARFADSNYMDAINASVNSMFKDKTDNKKQFRRYSFQSNEQVRRELYTLIKTSTIVPTANKNVVYPIDFYYFGNMYTTVDGNVVYCKPTNLNEIGPLQVDPFRKPTPKKTYYIENKVGLDVYFGTGTFTSASLTYLKTPDLVSIGTESDKIYPGGAVLTVGDDYIVYEDCEHDNTIYYAGSIFTATLTSLTAGIVIPTSVIVDCDLPENVHDEVCKMASEIMNGTIEDYNKSVFLQKEIEKQ